MAKKKGKKKGKGTDTPVDETPAKPEPKRLTIKRMIEEGGCTRESIREDLGITTTSLATNFTYLRLTGFYPIADDDGVLSFTDEDGWEEYKAERAENAKKRKSVSTKTPQERYDALVKRIARWKAALKFADDRLSNDPDNELLDLRQQKVDLEVKIAELEMTQLMDAHSDDIAED